MITNQRMKIGIVGANGQVGTEVCFFLSLMEGVEVVPICRTVLGSTLLRRTGLGCRHGDVGDADEAEALLGDLDLVVDFSLPRGLTADVRSATSKILANIAKSARDGAPLVYISSIMAQGFRARDASLSPRLFARTRYGASKRFAERTASRECKRSSRPLFVLRLGQVHGELQTLSRRLSEHLVVGDLEVPELPSNTVFAYSIAEALSNISKGREKPGVYTVISSPQWTWEEIYLHMSTRAGVDVRVVPVPFKTNRDASRRSLTALVRASLVGMLTRHGDVLAAHLLSSSPGLERRLRAAYMRRLPSSDNRTSTTFDVFGQQVGGKRLQTMTDSRITMAGPSAVVRELVKRALVDTGP